MPDAHPSSPRKGRILLPLVRQRESGMSPLRDGFALLPISLSFMALSHRSGRWSARLGTRAMMAAGTR